jgi:hypothetical protein
MSHRFDSGETPPDFIGLPHVHHWHSGCRPEGTEKFSKGQALREQIIEDAASGLTLQFEATTDACASWARWWESSAGRTG